MKFNLHTHTTRCGHAKGTDEEYVLKAIEAGYDVIGFSDHAPYIFPGKYKSGMRMQLNQTQDYVDSIRALAEKYKDKIDIKLGFELEWYPALIEKELEYLKSFNYDYLILGQHHTDNENDPWSQYVGSDHDEIVLFDKYISQLLVGAKSGEFTYVCHPDVFKFVGDEKVYIQKMTYMLKELKKLEIPLEYNFYGYYTNRHYPNDVFWKLVCEIGNPVVVGLDAHFPYVYGDERLEPMLEHMNELGLKPIDTIELIRK